MSQCLVIIKKDAIERGTIGKIISELECRNFSIVKMRMVKMSNVEAADLYIEHKDRKTFPGLIEFMITGPTLLMVVEHPEIKLVDRLNVVKVDLRSKYALYKTVYDNAIHISDSSEAAKREIGIFFKE